MTYSRRRALAVGKRLAALPHHRGFFPEWILDTARRRSRPYAAALAFAADPALERAAALARHHGVPCLGVEEGLIRSVSPASTGAPPLSLIVEDAGVFLANVPSHVDSLLDDAGWETTSLMSRASSLMEFKARERLARLNNGEPPDQWLGPNRRSRVLVIDRTSDERFLGRPAAPASSYVAAFEAARDEHPRADIVVLRGGLGALPPEMLALADVVIERAVDVLALIERMDAVYTVGSLVGLEAILCGRAVTCFGAPFYAGRGLTDDRAWPCGKPRTTEELFAAAYLLAPRYVDPLNGEPCSPEVGFERLAAFKRHTDRVAGRWAGLNITPAKQGVLRAFLAGPRSTYSNSRRAKADPATRLAVWASRPNGAARNARIRHPDRVVQVEDGLIRSVGLGSNFHPASSLIVDGKGIYYDPTRPSDMENLLNAGRFEHELLHRARALRQRIIELGLSKYNLGGYSSVCLNAPAAKRILVPGQVENDASVLTGGCGWTNLDLLRQVRDDNPTAFVIYKEHPDVAAGNRPGRVAASKAAELADYVTRDTDIILWIEAVDEVHTISSLAGFEALLRGKRVIAYGWPFYAGWGLTEDRGPRPGPNRRRLTLDELVAGALILHPLYLDPLTWLPCSPEVFVERLEALRQEAGGKPRRGRLTRFGPAVFDSLRPRRPPAY